METNNFIKTLGVFLMGWTLSGFGLAHILEAIEKPGTKQTQARDTYTAPLTLTLSVINAADNIAAESGLRVEFVQCSQREPYNRNAYNCQPLNNERSNTIDNPMKKQSQFTNANGMVTFRTDYPDQYSAPTTHFHVMVYDRFNNLIATSQFDFPDVVYPTMNAFYKAGGKNPADILADDPTANPPLLVTGNAIGGFAASRSIFIPANVSGIPQYEDGQTTQLSNLKNFPNPVINATTFAFQLTQPSEVEITVTDTSGTQVRTVFTDNLLAGAHEIEVDLGGLQKGIYFYKLNVSNNSGTYSEARKLIKV